MSKLNLDLVHLDEKVLTRLTSWFNFNLLYYTLFSIVSRLHTVTYSIYSMWGLTPWGQMMGILFKIHHHMHKLWFIDFHGKESDVCISCHLRCAVLAWVLTSALSNYLSRRACLWTPLWMAGLSFEHRLVAAAALTLKERPLVCLQSRSLTVMA